MSRSRIVRFSVAIAAAVVVTVPAVSRADVYVSASIGPRPVSFDVFYQQLSPYGAWVQCEPYGWIWMPAGVGVGWQPYTTGYWGYTSAWGYAWHADEVWGWAPFHYGNWVFTPAYGWAWVPGYSWGPAWVSWRYGAGFVGWAPLPPRYYGHHHGHGYGRGGRYQAPVQPDVRNNVAGTVDPKHYVVVPEERFQDTHVTTSMRREVGDTDINRMQQVERLPQLRVAKSDGGANVVNDRLGEQGPGARDLARVDHGDLGSNAQALDEGRGRDIGRTNDLDTGRVRDIGRTDATRTALPRLAPTPRLPAPGSDDRASRVHESGGARSTPGQDQGNFHGVPRTPSNQAQPRVMPSSPRAMPSQPAFNGSSRVNATPRSAPVMRASPAARPNFRAAPSSGPRAMPRSMPRGPR
ncbi:MAG: DUF6600 domain-containing protein [Myxococcota bacterium]